MLRVRCVLLLLSLLLQQPRPPGPVQIQFPHRFHVPPQLHVQVALAQTIGLGNIDILCSDLNFDYAIQV